MGNQASCQEGRRLMEEGSRAFQHEDFHSAIDLHLEALSYLKPHSADMAECLDHLVRDYWRVGDIAEALKYSKSALQISEQEAQRQQPRVQRQPQQQHSGAETESLARSLSNIGCIFYERGEYEKACYLLQGSLSIRQKIDAESLEVAITCGNVGLVLRQLGRIDEAVEMHHRAREIKEVQAPNSLTLARTYANLASLCPPVHAILLLVKAQNIATMQGELTTQESLLAAIDCNLANVHFREGNMEKAIELYQRAIEREQAVAPDSLVLAEMSVEIARAYEEDGQLVSARAARTKALEIRCRKVPTLLEQDVSKKEQRSERD